MNAIFFLFLAIISPLVLAAVFFTPLYGGVVGAAYLIYSPAAAGPNPLDPQLLNVFYMIDVYGRMFSYWLANMKVVSMLHYTAPLLGLPIVSLVVSIWISRKTTQILKDMFHRLGGSGH